MYDGDELREVAENLYSETVADERVRLHLEDGDEAECVIHAGDMQGDTTFGEWRWVGEHGDESVLIRIPFRNDEIQPAEAGFTDSPETVEFGYDDLRAITGFESLGVE